MLMKRLRFPQPAAALATCLLMPHPAQSCPDEFVLKSFRERIQLLQ